MYYTVAQQNTALPIAIAIKSSISVVSRGFKSGLAVNKYSPKKVLLSTYLLVNNSSLQEISTPLEIVRSVVFSQLNTPGANIFLGNTQPLKSVPLNRPS